MSDTNPNSEDIRASGEISVNDIVDIAISSDDDEDCVFVDMKASAWKRQHVDVESFCYSPTDELYSRTPKGRDKLKRKAELTAARIGTNGAKYGRAANTGTDTNASSGAASTAAAAAAVGATTSAAPTTAASAAPSPVNPAAAATTSSSTAPADGVPPAAFVNSDATAMLNMLSAFATAMTTAAVALVGAGGGGGLLPTAASNHGPPQLIPEASSQQQQQQLPSTPQQHPVAGGSITAGISGQMLSQQQQTLGQPQTPPNLTQQGIFHMPVSSPGGFPTFAANTGGHESTTINTATTAAATQPTTRDDVQNPADNDITEFSRPMRDQQISFPKPTPRPRILNVSHNGADISMSWTIDDASEHADVDYFEILTLKQFCSANFWILFGKVNPLPLPIGTFIEVPDLNVRYHFGVRVKDVYGREGEISLPMTWN